MKRHALQTRKQVLRRSEGHAYSPIPRKRLQLLTNYKLKYQINEIGIFMERLTLHDSSQWIFYFAWRYTKAQRRDQLTGRLTDRLHGSGSFRESISRSPCQELLRTQNVTTALARARSSLSRATGLQSILPILLLNHLHIILTSMFKSS
jgi:hypothetical protein